MVSGVILGLMLIPVLFVIFQNLQEKVSGKQLQDKDDHQPEVIKVDSEIIYS
ncbi:hypothetical protein D3C86_1406560 [compost metagenome]